MLSRKRGRRATTTHYYDDSFLTLSPRHTDPHSSYSLGSIFKATTSLKFMHFFADLSIAPWIHVVVIRIKFYTKMRLKWPKSLRKTQSSIAKLQLFLLVKSDITSSFLLIGRDRIQIWVYEINKEMANRFSLSVSANGKKILGCISGKL